MKHLPLYPAQLTYRFNRSEEENLFVQTLAHVGYNNPALGAVELGELILMRPMPSAPDKEHLTVQILREEAAAFAKRESRHNEPSIFGVDNGKTIGTYFEHKFQKHLSEKYTYTKGSSAKGIDFPRLGVDVKTTSIKQPQSSCPFKDARQKIFGLGYSVLLFVYQKKDDRGSRTARLNILHTIFIERGRTGDYQMTTKLQEIIKNNGNEDDVAALLLDRNLLVDDAEAQKIAKEILKSPPKVGYLTISNAYQWRLQYGHVIKKAGEVAGILRLE